MKEQQKNSTLKLFFFILLMIMNFYIYSQEQVINKELKNQEINSEVLSKIPSDFGFYFGTEMIFSSLKKIIAPKLGVALNLGAEYEYKGIKNLSIIPSVDFSIFHYGFQEGKAYISEIENRAALTCNLLADVPLMARFEINRWTISAGGGLAFLIRFGFLEPGIDPKENNSEGLTSMEEVKEINKYFWKKGRFIYPSLRFKTEYTFLSGWKTGMQVKAFLPISNLWDKLSNKFSDGLIIQAGIILHPAVTNKR